MITRNGEIMSCPKQRERERDIRTDAPKERNRKFEPELSNEFTKEIQNFTHEKQPNKKKENRRKSTVLSAIMQEETDYT